MTNIRSNCYDALRRKKAVLKSHCMKYILEVKGKPEGLAGFSFTSNLIMRNIRPCRFGHEDL